MICARASRRPSRPATPPSQKSVPTNRAVGCLMPQSNSRGQRSALSAQPQSLTPLTLARSSYVIGQKLRYPWLKQDFAISFLVSKSWYPRVGPSVRKMNQRNSRALRPRNGVPSLLTTNRKHACTSQENTWVSTSRRGTSPYAKSELIPDFE